MVVAPRNLGSPEYAADKDCVPDWVKVAVRMAVPLVRVAVPNTELPFMNCTVPVGVAEVRLVLPDAKLTDSVTVLPASAGFGVAVNVEPTDC